MVVLFFLLNLICAITDCPPYYFPNQNSNSAQVGHSIPPRTVPEIRFGRSFERSKAKREFPIVRTKFMEFRGRFLKSRNLRTISAFQGLPYAVPPTGKMRFRNPLPFKWPRNGTNIYFANRTRSDCLQVDISRGFAVRGAEDCLYLNVYVPEDTTHQVWRPRSDNGLSDGLLSVIIFVHGGAFVSLTSAPYGPRYLLDQNVILVTFNYRLGVLGFLSTGDAAAHGNFGLKDQVLAFKWVVDNIRDFGGDSNRITLIGQSAGAGMVGLHMISPLTTRAVSIQGAILLSGSSRSFWSLWNETITNTKQIAERMGCPTNTSKHLVTCLRGKDPTLVVGQQLNLWRIPVFSRFIFGAVIESPVANPAPFILEAPEVTYSRPNSIRPIPVICGMNRNEGAVYAANTYLVPFLFEKINKNWDEMVAYILGYDTLGRNVNVSDVSEEISRFYSFNKRWSSNNLNNISNVFTDRIFGTGLYKFLQGHSQVAPTYGFLFTHFARMSFSFTLLGLHNSEWGVSHGDELAYIFSIDQVFEPTDPEDVEISKFLVNVVTNFARAGLPLSGGDGSITWKHVQSPKNMELLEINRERSMIPFPYMERVKFWESLNLNSAL